MAQTFDTSRVGGGTYELALDANGNYKLNSVGFKQVNKLNLPDLKTSDTTSVADTTKKATEDTIKAQTTEVFTPSNVYQSGGDGQGANTQSMVKETKVKGASVRNVGDPMTNIAYGQTQDIKAGQTKADQAAPQESIGATDSIQPQYQDGILRGQTGVQYSKPPSLTSRATSAVQDTVSGVIDSVKNNKAIQFTSNVLGFAMNPLMGGIKAVAGMMPKDTQDDKHRRGYFNMDDASQGGRISGNPATDLYAGMNAVSMFGNIEKAGKSRIDKREVTSTKLSGVKKEKFDAVTQGMKEQQNDYVQSRMEDRVASNKAKGINAREAGITNKNKDGTTDGGGGQGGGRVICTDLHRTGELSTRDWVRDTKFTFKTLSKTHVKGYLLWAEPTVKHIQKYPRYRKMWKHIAQHRANDIAWRLNEGKFDLLGRIYAGIGEPVCWALGNFVSDKQISKYNLTHWRRA
jgi:hypothetical protein